MNEKPDKEARWRAARFWIGFGVFPVVAAVSLSVFAATTTPIRFVQDHSLLTLLYFIAVGIALVAVGWVLITWRGNVDD